MVTVFYFIVFIFALVLTGSFLVRNKNVDSVFILFSILVTINCFGRYMLATAENLEMAIWANKFMYIGGAYAPLLTVVVLAKLCNVKLPRLLITIMTAYSTLIVLLVMTIGKYGIYYKQVELGYGNGYNYLIKTYGPLHALYPIMMIIYTIIMFFYVIYALKSRKQISFRTVITISITSFSIMFLYILERATGTKISFLAIGYLIGIAIVIKYFERINMYDMSSNIVSSIEKINEYGYLVFDDKYRYVNSNNLAKELFPEIKEWVVDKKVPVSDSYVYTEIIEYLNSWNPKEKVNKILHIEDRYFRLNIRPLSYGKKTAIGYLLELTDCTLEEKYYHTIEEYNASLEKEVAEKTEHILHIKDMMVLKMADMVESRDNNTGGHIKRTSAVINVFSHQLNNYIDKLGIDENFLRQVEKAAPMHDLGKIAIDDAILRKPGKYTEEEYAQMKKHPLEGAKIVESILKDVEDDDFLQITKNIALYHHEKWNGQGYPFGLSETNIPLEARIMALADVFDALVSKRCYKEAFSYNKAFSIIEEDLGEHFDPELGKIFLECRRELEELYTKEA
ncbi:MAG: HD domain-containing protein [Lachnospiraceae bacterium]|nr:HD domain-containing protein [Lachnospiraceae bacterium]